MKKLSDIAWNIPEEEYRQDPSLSYSTLAKYERGGFNALATLFEPVSSDSLTFGSAVDAIITGGQEEFDKTFFVCDFPGFSFKADEEIVKNLFDIFGETYNDINDISDNAILTQIPDDYQKTWKKETKIRHIKEYGEKYYALLKTAKGRRFLTNEEKEVIDKTVEALKTSPSTNFYFRDDADGLDRFYQLKFKATLGGIDYRCMADLLVVDPHNKVIYPVDLKTSSHTEWDFFKSFVDFNYQIQSRLYWRIIRDNLDKDPEFKDYKLVNYTFVVVNKKTLTPLAWKYEDTQKTGTMYYGKNKQIIFRDPEEIGAELTNYLKTTPRVPNGIKENEPNDIINYLNNL